MSKPNTTTVAPATLINHPKEVVHYYPLSGFSIRLRGRTERPAVRFDDSLWRTEEISRPDAARLMRAANKAIRAYFQNR